MFEWMDDRIADVQGTAAAREQGWRFLLNPPATGDEVRRCEEALGLPLPPSYRAFLSRWNGASLFRRESPWPNDPNPVSSEFGIKGTHDLPSFHGKFKATVLPDILPEEWGNLIVFCAVPSGSGDHCALDPDQRTAEGEYAVVDCFHELRPRCWRRAVIAPSFEAWLRRAFDAALQKADPYYWLNLPELLALYRECHEEDRKEAAEFQSRRAQDLQGPLPPPSSPTVHSTVSTGGRAIRHRRDRKAKR